LSAARAGITGVPWDVESGLVDDPFGPGRLTKFGISQRAYPNLNIRDLAIDGARLYTARIIETFVLAINFRRELL
jgi:hypothetical protein